MVRIVTLRLEKDAYERVAGGGGSGTAPAVELSLRPPPLERVREAQFVDGGEMAEILNDDALVRRLRAGSQQAHRRKGDFVA